MRTFFMLLYVTVVLLFHPTGAAAWSGSVISIVDGDTITVAPAGDTSSPLKIRLYGIDAPEHDQSYGLQSTQKLASLLPKDSSVEVISLGQDRYGRIVALIAKDNHIINGDMVSSGAAWVFAKYCKADVCKSWYKLQQQASDKRLGLWEEDSPIAPWQWRKNRQ